MGTVQKRQLSSLTELGGIFLEIDQAFTDADYKPTLASFLPELEKFEEGLFNSQSAPDGTPWAPINPKTAAAKGPEGFGILFDTGRLMSSLVGQTDDSIRDIYDHGLTFGEDVPYSIFHQDGYTPMRGQGTFGEGVPFASVPARPHVGVNDEILDRFCGKIADATVEALKG